MAVGGKEVVGCQSFVADIVGDGLALIVVVGTAVDDDTVERLVADDVGVLLKEVEGEGLDGNHNGRYITYLLRNHSSWKKVLISVVSTI